MSDIKLKRLVDKKLSNKQNRLIGEPGYLGNEAGEVDVSGKPGYVYVRMAGQPVAQVYNQRVTPEYNLPVIVGCDPYNPYKLQILSTRNTASSTDETYQQGAITNHHLTHEWFATGGGTDTVFMQLRQFMPLRITPISGSVAISVYRGHAFVGGTWTEISTSLLDLSASRPTTSGKAKYMLVYVATDGTITTSAGSEKDILSLALSDIPTPPANCAIILGAVRLFYGQTSIIEARTQTDIVDLRFPYWVRLTVGTGGNVNIGREIQLQSNSLDLIVWYPATATGLDQATAAATAGDTIVLPAGSIDGDHTCKASVSYVGLSKDRTILTGEITLEAGASLQGIGVLRSVSSADAAKAVVFASSGAAYITDCSLRVDQSGAGETRCLSVEADNATVHIRDCYLWANASGSGTYYEFWLDTSKTAAVIHAYYCMMSSDHPMNAPVNVYGCLYEDDLAIRQEIPYLGDRAYLVISETEPGNPIPGMIWVDPT